jgi:Meckel syndrome type 1 protein
MKKTLIALLAVSVSLLAVACGGGQEEAKAPEGAAAAPADTGAPAAAPADTGAPAAAPADTSAPAAAPK